MMELGGIGEATGLSPDRRDELDALLRVLRATSARNELLHAYYESDREPAPIGVDTVPDSAKPRMRCGWPRKAVTSVSERVRFDGFVFEGDASDDGLAAVERRSFIKGAYNRCVASELVHGCMFATVNRGPSGATVRFHSADAAAGVWDMAEGRLASGLVVADARRTPWSPDRPVPVLVNMHLPGEVVVLERGDDARWRASVLPTPMDRPMMEAFAYRPTGAKPLGQSRITKAVMDIADEVSRTLANMSVSAALYAAPQKYLLGLTDEQYDEVKKDKWSAAIGSVLLSTRDEEGNVPSYGQLPATSPQPYIDAIRAYAGLFSGETGVPLNSLGIVSDNPSSAEAIAAAREDVCIAAEDLIESNGESMRNVALMAMAVEGNVTMDSLTEAQRSVMARFRDPTKPSLVSQADASIKIASVLEGYAQTDVFLEQLGFDGPTVERIRAALRRSSATQAMEALVAASRARAPLPEGGSDGDIEG